MTTHGLVVGKFYPPHLGHHRLIDWAATRCAELTVLAMAATGESVPLPDRIDWLHAAHADLSNLHIVGVRCDVPVDFDNDAIWSAQLAVMRAALDNAGRPPVDAVFSSEAYGDELAARLSATHVLFDPDRRLVPISSSRVRADMVGNW